MRNLDLNVDDPNKVAGILDNAAQDFYESAGELEEAWQDPKAGKPWEQIAKILERAADQIRKRIGG